MSDTKTSGLSALGATPATGDMFMVVDVSDTTMAATGTNKYLVASYVVSLDRAETLTNKTLTTPVIGDFTNAGHSHTSSAGGGQLDHGTALTGLGDDDHTQYLLATGTRTGASSQAQTFTSGVITDKIYPASDSTNAFGLYKADGTSQDVYYNSTAGKLGVGVTPANKLDVYDTADTPVNIVRESTATATSSGIFNAAHRSTGSATDGFGAHQSFRIQDSGNIMTTIGQVGFVRDGAHNTGALVVRNTVAGSITERMRLLGSGNLGVGVTVPTAVVHAAASTTTRASFCAPHGTAPTSPVNGDMWTTTAGLFVQINGSTIGPLS